MNDLQYKRQQAAKAIADKITSWGNIPAPQSDRLVDDLARNILGLPTRGEAEPYGWILPLKEDVKIKKQLDIPYLKQLNNKYNPHSSCLLTATAMSLRFYGINKTPDELYLLFNQRGWDRYTHDNVARLFREFGIEDSFSTTTSWEQVRINLSTGNPVIMSGKFTKSGHIIILRGFDEGGFWINDPYGEYFASGYNISKSGENLYYSNNLLYRVSYGGSSTTWAHLLQGKSQEKALESANSVDVDVLARTIWGESRNQDRLGKIAVAWVVKNRASRPSWPNSIKEVCQQPWQFSCWNGNDPNLPKMKALNDSDPLFKECKEIAKKVLEGQISDPTGGADHYYASYIPAPAWARGKKPSATIGAHIFFKLT